MQKEIAQPLVATVPTQKDGTLKRYPSISMPKVNLISKILLIPMRILSVMVILTMSAQTRIPLTGRATHGLLVRLKELR